MIHKDARITGVRQNRKDELIYRVIVKAGDYDEADYKALHVLDCEDQTFDLEVKGAEATTAQVGQKTYEVDQTTGEIAPDMYQF